MIKRLGYIFLTLFWLMSCGEEVISKPEGLIAKDKMINILHDMALINAAKTTAPSVLEERKFSPMEFIYQKYNIDSVQLVSSNLYYASIPLEYEDIYEKLESRIDEQKDSLESDRTQRKDSVISTRK